MTHEPTEVTIEASKPNRWARPSIVWIIPFFALAIMLFVAWQAVQSRGPLIEISFENGAGVIAGKTELRYREVTVGKVENVKFSDSLDSVIVEIRLKKDVASFVDKSSVFWVVSPQVSAQGVSGLGTVLSGVYIEGSWDNEAGPTQTKFLGLNEIPLIQPGELGLQITLRSGRKTALTDDAPILFRGIEVGRIGRAHIVPNGEFAISEAVIYDKYRHLVSQNTRFWDVSGFDFNVGAGGAELRFQSIASLISGGLTFDTIVSGGGVVQDGQVFLVYANENEARTSIFSGPEAETLELSVIFEDNVAGLKTDAVVEWNGLKIGEVSNISGVINREMFGDNSVRLNATIALHPARLGLESGFTATDALAFLEQQVSKGLRARLASANILTGGLKIELVNIENAPAQTINMDGDPFPIMPSSESVASDVSASAEGVLKRFNKLPIEDLMASAINVLDSANAFFKDEDLRETPQELRGLIGDARELVGSPEVQKVPAQLNDALARFDGLLAELETQQTVAKLNQALEDASNAANSVNAAIEGVPELIESLDKVASKAEALEVEELIESANGVLESAEKLISSDDTAQLPASLSAALLEIRETLKELREGGAVKNTNEALASARDAADAIALSAKDLPGLVERMTRVLNQAAATLQAYDTTSDVNRGTRDALRNIQEAAAAITSLARSIQRNPNSLLLGK